MSLFKKLFPGSGKAGEPHEQTSVGFSAGDLFYSPDAGKYRLYKLLVHDVEFACYHVLMYEPVDALPVGDEIDRLEIFAYHAPIDANAFAGSMLLANRPVKADDLIGYHEYLKQTQDPQYYISIANGYYREAIRLTDENRHLEAIDSYSKAIDLFPQFFEAIDNRAFCKMDLGLWEEAIEDFRLSLEENPGSMLAEFSIGECYFRLQDYQQARQQFEKAQEIEPDHPAPGQFLEKIKALQDE